MMGDMPEGLTGWEQAVWRAVKEDDAEMISLVRTDTEAWLKDSAALREQLAAAKADNARLLKGLLTRYREIANYVKHTSQAILNDLAVIEAEALKPAERGKENPCADS